MTLDHLDNEELLRLSLSAIESDRDADAISMLKEIVARQPDHFQAVYLLAAQHAQIGMFDRAESEFRAAVEMAPDFPVARFQLGQLLAMSGRAEEARGILQPILEGRDALGAYSRAMVALAEERADVGLREIEEGLALPQPIPALANDMRRLSQSLREAEPERTPTAPVYLAGYGYGRPGGVE